MTTVGPVVDLVICRTGDADHEELLGAVAEDPALLGRMRADAEAERAELLAAGTTWVIAAVHAGGRRVAAAWAGAIVIEEDGQPVLKAVCSYEVPAWRGHGLYALAYAERHRAIVEQWLGPAVTYIFEQPLDLHLADGWEITCQGVSDCGHAWYELRRSSGYRPDTVRT